MHGAGTVTFDDFSKKMLHTLGAPFVFSSHPEMVAVGGTGSFLNSVSSRLLFFQT